MNHQDLKAPGACPVAKITTNEMSYMLRVKPQTVRASLCRSGCYLNLRPIKLKNGKLLWNLAEVERLIAGEVLQ